MAPDGSQDTQVGMLGASGDCAFGVTGTGDVRLGMFLPSVRLQFLDALCAQLDQTADYCLLRK
jgi:hypothetical protein